MFRRYFYAFALRYASLSCLWGCSNRISNGRAVCDSHHVNEDTLQNTYTAAIRDMIEDAEEIMTAVKESAGLVMEPENYNNRRIKLKLKGLTPAQHRYQTLQVA